MRGRGRDIADILDLVQNCLPSPPPEVTMFASSAADFREEIKLSYKTTVIMDKGGPHDCPAVAESGKSNQVPCFLYKCITEVHV